MKPLLLPKYGNTSEKARRAKKLSPWSKGPNCATPKAKQSFTEYERRGKAPHPGQ